MNRQDVYKLIDGEREYQDLRWNPSTTTSGGLHSPEEWLVYIEDYVNEAKHIVTREPNPLAIDKTMDIIRKVAGMAVAAMEQIETKPRVIPDELRKGN